MYLESIGGLICFYLADPTALMPTLWIGTTQGSVLTMTISLPEAEHRHTQPVVLATSGTLSYNAKQTLNIVYNSIDLVPFSNVLIIKKISLYVFRGSVI